MPSEFSFINQIRQRAIKAAPNLVFGIGDDAAIWSEHEGRERLITTDLLIEEVHFKIAGTPLFTLGHKALAVSLSDIAAMGGTPEFALLSLGIPTEQIAHLPWEDFFAGYFALAEKFGVALIGGDTSSSPDKLVIDSIVLGSCRSGQAIRRSTAQIGDAIYVTGNLGASAAGLHLLLDSERFSAVPDEAKSFARQAHLMPEPRVAFGQKIGELQLVHAMMDVSDGLAQDLAHICEESSVDAIIDFTAVPIADCVSVFWPTRDEAFSLAVSGGEDYELLFTAAPQAEAELQACAAECAIALTRIGEILARDSVHTQARIFLQRNGRVDLLPITGYDHFRV